MLTSRRRKFALSALGLIAVLIGFATVYDGRSRSSHITEARATPSELRVDVVRSGEHVQFRQHGDARRTRLSKQRWLPKAGQRFYITADTPCWNSAAYLARAREFVHSGRFDPKNPMPMMHDYTGATPSSAEAPAPYSVAGPGTGVLIGYNGIVLARVPHGFDVIFPSDSYEGDPRDDMHANRCFLPDDLPIFAPGWRAHEP